jgi:hypothetical protein
LRRIEWLARDPNIEFVEQPLPASSPANDFLWLKARSPLPIVADESYLHASDVALCAECFHGVNVKLCKAGGVTRGFEALSAARQAGLKTMLGCMTESSILTAAGAHLAELTNWLDLDGNVLNNNDPFAGVTSVRGVMSFSTATEPVRRRSASGRANVLARSRRKRADQQRSLRGSDLRPGSHVLFHGHRTVWAQGGPALTPRLAGAAELLARRQAYSKVCFNRRKNV